MLVLGLESPIRLKDIVQVSNCDQNTQIFKYDLWNFKSYNQRCKAFRSRAASRIMYVYTPSRHVLFLTMCCKQKRVTELSGTWKVKMCTQRLVVIGERFYQANKTMIHLRLSRIQRNPYFTPYYNGMCMLRVLLKGNGSEVRQ